MRIGQTRLLNIMLQSLTSILINSTSIRNLHHMVTCSSTSRAWFGCSRVLKFSKFLNMPSINLPSFTSLNLMLHRKSPWVNYVWKLKILRKVKFFLWSVLYWSLDAADKVQKNFPFWALSSFIAFFRLGSWSFILTKPGIDICFQ